MKKLIVFLSVLSLICVLSIDAMADGSLYDYERMSADDRADILNNEESILSDLNAVLETEQIKGTLEELPLEDYVKIYIDTDVFSMDSVDYISIEEEVSDNYVYTCLMTVDDVRVEYTLGEVEDLTDDVRETLTADELEEMSEKVGKWCVSSVSVLESGESSYTELVDEKSFDKYDDVILAGSLAGFRYPVAIGFANGQAEDIITLRDNSAYEIMEYVADVQTSDQVGDVFDYEMISEIAQEQFITSSGADTDQIGGGATQRGSKMKMNVVLFVAIVAVIGIIFVIGRLSRTEYRHQR